MSSYQDETPVLCSFIKYAVLQSLFDNLSLQYKIKICLFVVIKYKRSYLYTAFYSDRITATGAVVTYGVVQKVNLIVPRCDIVPEGSI